MGFFKTLGKSLLGGFTGGLTSGLEKRIDQFVAGRRASPAGYLGTGGATAQQAAQRHSTQIASQGQSTGYNVAMEQISSQERMQQKRLDHEKQMLEKQLSANGQGDAGQVPWWMYHEPPMPSKPGNVTDELWMNRKQQYEEGLR